MSVLSAAEQDVMDDFAAGIAVPRPRAAAGSPAAGGRELRIRQVRVSEVRVSEIRAGERHAEGVRTRQVRGREVRSLTVRASEVRGGEMRRGQSRPAGPGMPGSGRPAGLRLTRRGRVVLAGLAIAVVTAVATAMLFWLSAAGNAQAASHGQLPGAARWDLSRVVVRPGQTLWSIARRAEPSADPRVVVQQIIEVNALGSPVIQPGELLWVPNG
jgi:LysM domain